MTTFKSKYYSDLILNWKLGTQMPTPPANLYLGLLITMPTKNDGTSAVEVSGGSYARVQVTPAEWAAITTAGDNLTEQHSTNAAVTFPAATANWGTILGGFLADAATAGNTLEYATLASGSQVINSGNQFSLPAGSITDSEV
jgi:hypothetical protein